MPTVAVVILNWNGAHLLRTYLPSVVRYTPGAEVVVADNGSTDESLQMLASEFPTVRVLPLGSNYGFAQGYNLAIRRLNHDYIILLNDDVRVVEGWLEPLVDYMQQHSECGALQPKLLSDRHPEAFEYAGAAGGYLDRLCYPYCRGRIFDTLEVDHGQYDEVRRVMWATGACLMVRRELYVKAGGLDAHFFAHMEEIDLCWRIRRMGYEVVCQPSSRVYHLGGGSLPVDNPRKTLLNFRNSLLMMHKNLPVQSRGRMLLARRCLDGVAALRFLLVGQWRHAQAIWQAHREFARMSAQYYADVSGDVGEAASDRFPESRISVLWQYYIRRRRTFSRMKLPSL